MTEVIPGGQVQDDRERKSLGRFRCPSMARSHPRSQVLEEDTRHSTTEVLEGSCVDEEEAE